MSSRNPKYLWGRENQNWVPPEKASDMDPEEMFLTDPVNDFSSGITDDEREEMIEDSSEDFIERFSDIEGPSSMYIKSPYDNFSGGDDFAYIYSEANYGTHREGIEDGTYLALPFSSDNTYREEANEKTLSEGYMGDLPKGSYIDSSRKEVMIPLDAWDKASRGEGDDPARVMNGINEVANATRMVEEEYPVLNDSHYHDALVSASEDSFSQLYMENFVDSEVDDKSEDFALEHDLDEDDPKVEEYRSEIRGELEDILNSDDLKDKMVSDAVDRFERGWEDSPEIGASTILGTFYPE